MAEWIDSHAHTAFPEFDADREAMYARARDAGVRAIVEVGVGLEKSRRAVEMARKWPILRPAVGIHPIEAATYPRDWDALEELVRGEDVIAIGECGLDYYWMKAPKERQEECFRRQIELARQSALPYIVHCREAEEDLLRILADTRYARGVVHCFAGSRDQAERILALGLRISFCANITYRKNEALREAARAVPLDRLMVETDAPFLAPERLRGKRNEPANVPILGEFLASLHGVPVEELARRTTANARRFFDLKPEGTPGTIAYRIGENLYVNVTRLCTAHCYFCPREGPDRVAWGHDLALERDPGAAEILEAVGDPSPYREVVFCGLGEPMIRLKTLLEVARALKAKGARIRVNTNGHGNLIHGRDVTPELHGLVDSVSISLNAQDAETYDRDCPSTFGLRAFDGILDFATRAKDHVPEVVLTAVEGAKDVDIEACRRLAGRCGVRFRARPLDDLKEDRRSPDDR